VKPSQRISATSASVNKEFLSLADEAIFFRPAKGKWSIAQCIDHLTQTSLAYRTALDRMVDPEYRATFWESISPFSQRIGKGMAESLGIAAGRAFKSPRIFEPRRQLDSARLWADFFTQQEHLLNIVLRSEGSDVGKRILTSPVSHLITFPASSLCEMIASHQERHIRQAMAVKASAGFPQ
jgi:hypothetical protein